MESRSEGYPPVGDDVTMAVLVVRAVCPPDVTRCDVTCWADGGDRVAPCFFQGWKPFPMAASASGGGDLLLIREHWAASIARGVPP